MYRRLPCGSRHLYSTFTLIRTDKRHTDRFLLLDSVHRHYSKRSRKEPTRRTINRNKPIESTVIVKDIMSAEAPVDTGNPSESSTGSHVTDSSAAEPEALPQAPKIFSTSRPKDVLDGTMKGVGNILTGALSGAAMMVTAPVAGAYQGAQTGGAFGAVKGLGVGLGLGVVGGAALIVGGTATGLYQMGRGVYNTPEAFGAATKGYEWDDSKKKWILYKLQEEAAILEQSEEDFLKENAPQGATGTEKAEAEKPKKDVHDLEFYEVLGVSSNATQGEIKKAYYMKAKQSHPDRHPDDPDAHSKFQKIGEAYQVLSDEKLRANYDARGKEGVEDAPKMDSSALYSILFGSEKFEPLIGELKVASYLQQASNQANGVSNEEPPLLQKFRQRKREVQCAVNLAAKLQPYVDSEGDIQAYQNLLLEEMKDLTSSPVASALLSTIGSSYLEYAKKESSTMDSFNVGFQQASRGLRTRATIASAGIGAAFKARELQKAQEKLVASKQDGKSSAAEKGKEEETLESILSGREGGTAEEKDFAKKVQEISGQMFSMIWHLTELDIRNTLSKVCHKVIYDKGVDNKTRELRLQALRILGDVFCQSGGSIEEGMKDLMVRLGMTPNPAASPSQPANAAEATRSDNGSSASANEDNSKQNSKRSPEKATYNENID